MGGVAGGVAGDMAANAIGKATGYGLRNNLHTPYSQFIHGIPYPVVKESSRERVRKHGRIQKHMLGGSFLPL